MVKKFDKKSSLFLLVDIRDKNPIARVNETLANLGNPKIGGISQKDNTLSFVIEGWDKPEIIHAVTKKINCIGYASTDDGVKTVSSKNGLTHFGWRADWINGKPKLDKDGRYDVSYRVTDYLTGNFYECAGDTDDRKLINRLEARYIDNVPKPFFPDETENTVLFRKTGDTITFIADLEESEDDRTEYGYRVERLDWEYPLSQVLYKDGGIFNCLDRERPKRNCLTFLHEKKDRFSSAVDCMVIESGFKPEEINRFFEGMPLEKIPDGVYLCEKPEKSTSHEQSKAENICSNLSVAESEVLYRKLKLQHVRKDVTAQSESKGLDLSEKEIERVAEMYVYEEAYNLETPYWENIDELIRTVRKKRGKSNGKIQTYHRI